MKKLTLVLSIIILLFVSNGCQRFATIHGTIRDSETDKLLEGVSVEIRPNGEKKTTESDGRYMFNELDPDQYTITVSKTGYKTTYETVTVYPDDKKEKNFKMTIN